MTSETTDAKERISVFMLGDQEPFVIDGTVSDFTEHLAEMEDDGKGWISVTQDGREIWLAISSIAAVVER